MSKLEVKSVKGLKALKGLLKFQQKTIFVFAAKIGKNNTNIFNMQ